LKHALNRKGFPPFWRVIAANAAALYSAQGSSAARGQGSVREIKSYAPSHRHAENFVHQDGATVNPINGEGLEEMIF
jgi:hypothetical protein